MIILWNKSIDHILGKGDIIIIGIIYLKVLDIKLRDANKKNKKQIIIKEIVKII